jgi:hypothetical protein
VPQTNFPRLQPLLEIIRGLRQKGLTDEEILWTFLSCGVQPLPQQEPAVKVPLVLGCLVHPSFS